jgi:hypothetical protein
MNNLNLFFRLSKVDEARREVYGIATAEVADKTGEICDYETTVPYYKAWSAEIQKASNGKSLGNVREMHDNKAVGKLTQINFDDDKKQIEVCAKIVEESTWQKVVEGVLLGFSQGGSYVKTWKDAENPEFTRYTADPSEISVVDNPCLGTATFEYIKSDGSKEIRKAIGAAQADDLKQVWRARDGSTHDTKAIAKKHNESLEATVPPGVQLAKDILKQLEDPMYWEADDVAKKQFSDEKRKKLASEGKALPDGSYPIESKGDLANAIHAIGRAKDPEKAKAHIIARAKALGATAMLPADWEGSTKKAAKPHLKKGMQEIARAACLIQELDWLHHAIEFEQDMEADDSANPAHLFEIIKELGEFLCNLCEEETREMAGGDDEDDVMEMAAGLSQDQFTVLVKFFEAESVAKLLKESSIDFAEIIQKAGARHSAADKAHLSDMHDHMEKMGKHIDKLHKLHKAMDETHDKMDAKDEHHGEMGDHIDKMHKCANSMEKCHGNMQECMKGLGMEDAGTEKMAALATANESLTKTISEMTTTLEAIQKRLTTVEKSPATSKVAVMVTKGDEQQTGNVAGEPSHSTVPSVISPEMYRARQPIN